MPKHIKIRSCQKNDHNFLFATYLKNHWYDKENSTTLKKHTWMSLQHNRLEKVLKEDRVKIACLTEDEDIILGYAFKDPEKPFVYIKLAWRNPKLEIHKNLVDSLEIT